MTREQIIRANIRSKLLIVAFNIVLVGLVVLLPSRSRPPTSPKSVEAALERLASINVDPDHYPSDSDYKHLVYLQVQGIVAQFSSPSDLNVLFHACTRLWRAAPERPQEQLKWTNAHSLATDAVVNRLVELDSDEATRVMVDLFADDRIPWDAASALGIGRAVSRCGRRALPYLAKIRPGARKDWAQEIVHCIERGELCW